MTSRNNRKFDFTKLFSAVNESFSRAFTLNTFTFTDVTVLCAISKCIDFNILVNKNYENKILPYFLTANSRSICEDIIYLSFMRLLDKEKSEELISTIQILKLKQSILTQTRFFIKNNPMQPTYGAHIPIEEQEIEIKRIKRQLEDLWQHHGLPKKPSTRELSSKVGLDATYEYIFYLTSNLVHFHPHYLMQQGWATGEGFEFSPGTIAIYHSELGRFLGAILFLGYCYGYSEKFDNNIRDTAIQEITSELKSGIRWPEIVTYEEMNEELPNIILRAFISWQKKEVTAEPLPDIFIELRNLGNNQV